MAHAGEHHPAAARNRTRLGEMVGPYRLVPPEMRRAGAVLIGCPELLQPPQRLVGVFPPRIDDPAVVQQRWHKIRLAVVADQVDVLAVRVATGQDVRVDERPTPHVGVAARRGEQDVSVRQVDRDRCRRNRCRSVAAAPVPSMFISYRWKLLLVVRLVAEEDLPCIEREVRPPETAGLVGRQLPDWATRVQAIQHPQPTAGHRHDPHAMDRFVGLIRVLAATAGR